MEGGYLERPLEIAQLAAEVVASTVASSVHLVRKRPVVAKLVEDHICALELLRDFLGHKAQLECQALLHRP